MSYQLILPFFPEELRALLLDPSISDLMINGTTGVYPTVPESCSTFHSRSRTRTNGYRRRLSA
jgi:hypothetical protein